MLPNAVTFVNMESSRVEAIILHTLRYGDSDQIVTAFTPERGVIKLIFKQPKRASRDMPMISALSRVEIVYVKGRGELYLGREVMIIDNYSSLRNSLACIQAGCDLLEIVRVSQNGEHPVPLLYRLLCTYLQHLSAFVDTDCALTSFRLKVLKHEGLLSDEMVQGLNEEDCLFIQVLAGCRKLQDIVTLPLPPGLADKVKQRFHVLLTRM